MSTQRWTILRGSGGHTPAKNVEIKVLEKVVSSVLRDNYGKKNRFTYF